MQSQIEELFTQALGIKAPWNIIRLKFDPLENKLDVYIDFQRGAMFEIENPKTQVIEHCKAYDKVEKTWRHLNFFEYQCLLHIKVPRVKPSFGGIKMIFPDFAGQTYGFTLLFEAFILELSKNMPVRHISKLLKVSDYKVWSVLESYIEKALAFSDNSNVTKLGIDETSIKKRHAYISQFVNLEERKTIHVAEGKDNTVLKDFKDFFECTNGKTSNITDVSIDMSPAFIKGVKENMPNAEITFDKFHIIKKINEAVDLVRKSEAQQNKVLRGTKFIFLRNEENLTESQKDKKNELSKMNLETFRAMHIRENFQEIYLAEDSESFKILLEEWYEWAISSNLEPIVKIAKTIKNHWDGIIRWKVSQINNGILEGLNSVVQAAKRKARGYKFNHFRIITFLLTGKLDFSKLNPYIPT
jgi:transposase